MTNTEVAEIILQQIQAGEIYHEPQLRNKLMILRAANFVAFDDGVKFTVNGDKLKGSVVVKLNYATDTYDLEFYGSGKHKEVVNDIYNDQLAQVIWDRVVIV